jgi:hypothetical protein
MASSGSYRYAIRVQGHLDPHWSEWLEGMTITHEEGGVTLLEGAILDPAALRGLLNKLQDLCLPLLELKRLKVAMPTHAASVKKGDHPDGNDTS